MPDFLMCRILPAFLCLLLADGPREDPPVVLVPWSEMREAPALETWLREAWQEPGLVVRQHLPTDPLPSSAQGRILLGYEEVWLRGRGEEGALLPWQAEGLLGSFAGGWGQPLCLETWTLGLAGGTADGDRGDAPQAWSDLEDPRTAARVHLRVPTARSRELRVLEFLARRQALHGQGLATLRWGAFEDGTLFSPGASWRSLFTHMQSGDLCLAPIREMTRPGRGQPGPLPLALREGFVTLTLGAAFGTGTSPEWQARFRELLTGEPLVSLCAALDLESLDGTSDRVSRLVAGSPVGRVTVPADGGATLREELLRLYPVQGESSSRGLDKAWVELFDMVALVVCAGVLVFVAWIMWRKSL